MSVTIQTRAELQNVVKSTRMSRNQAVADDVRGTNGYVNECTVEYRFNDVAIFIVKSLNRVHLCTEISKQPDPL